MRFPFDTSRLYEPPTEFAWLVRHRPVAPIVLPTGDPAWLVCGYEEVRVALSDPRFSRAAATAPDAPRMRPLPPDRRGILAMDPPAHTRLRRLVARAFAARRVREMRGDLEHVAADLLDRLSAAGPPADLVPGFALPLPITVICALLGVPPADRATFSGWTDTMLTLTGSTADEVGAARAAMNGYLADLVAKKRRNPPAANPDLMDELIAARDEEDRLSEEELIIFASTLLIAGYHTTSAAIVNSVVVLMRHPEQYRRLVREPARVPSTVDELLRYSAAATNGGNLRVAVEPVTLGGVDIKPGEAVLPAIIAANRDPAVFADPDRFDPDRADNPHLAFGGGVHYCLGANLARLELEVALTALTTRFSALRLAVDEAELSWDDRAVIKRLDRLPVAW
ncbi:cytochrome P450 [Micromonospora sp. CPCC 206061]|uniref:cytochrome P450 n=1 Tax=Micromonospora sp. CPCC 206061 TaxID=3122410 RepID=UPI002FF18753